MSEHTHTVGKWRADGPPHNRIVWIEGTDDRICFMAHSDGKDAEGDIARSNLVAAAPELLEALEWIERVCCEEIPLEYNDAMRKAFQRNVRDAAAAAIARARGE